MASGVGTVGAVLLRLLPACLCFLHRDHSRLASPRRRLPQRWVGPSSPSQQGWGYQVPEVPHTEVMAWLANDWSKRLPQRELLLSLSPEPMVWGLRLCFDGMPQDSVDIGVIDLLDSDSGCLVTVSRPDTAEAAVGSLGGQMASLVKSTEATIQTKLESDLKSMFGQVKEVKVAIQVDEEEDAGEAQQEQLPTGAGARGGEHEATAAGSGRQVVEAQVVPSPPPPPLPSTPPASPPPRDAVAASPSKDSPALDFAEPNRVETLFEDTGTSDELQARIASGDLDTNEALELLRGIEDAVKETGGDLEALGKTSDMDILATKAVDFEAAIQEAKELAKLDDKELADLFERGAAASMESDAISRVEEGLVQFKMALGSDLEGGLDLFTGPPKSIQGSAGAASSAGVRVVEEGEAVREEAFANSYFRREVEYASLTGEEKEAFDTIYNQIEVLIRELDKAPEDIQSTILSSYRDVVLSEWWGGGKHRRDNAPLSHQPAVLSLTNASP